MYIHAYFIIYLIYAYIITIDIEIYIISDTLLWRDTMTMATLSKKSFNLGLAYSWRDLVHYPHGGKHGSLLAYLVLKCSAFESAGSRKETEPLGLPWASEILKSILSDPFPSESHTYPNKAIPLFPKLCCLPDDQVFKHNEPMGGGHSYSSHRGMSVWQLYEKSFLFFTLNPV